MLYSETMRDGMNIGTKIVQNSSDIDFYQMSTHYGEVVAYGYLEQIEIASGISPRQMVGVSPEIRLAHAIRIQDANRISTLSMAA